MQTIVSLVAAELGVALVPSSVQNLQRVGVAYKPIEAQTPKIELAMAWRRWETSIVLHQFIEQTRAIAGSYETHSN